MKNDDWEQHWPAVVRLSQEVTRQELLTAKQNEILEAAKRALKNYIEDVEKKIKLEVGIKKVTT